MTTILIVTRPPEDERHPRTGGYMCDLCARYQPRVIDVDVRDHWNQLRICDECVRSLAAAVGRLP